MRRIGVSAVIIECARPYCYHQARFTFDTLALPDELSSLDITRHRRFVCTKCGARKVTAYACWADYSALGNGVPPRRR
jgi:hypothetical protein